MNTIQQRAKLQDEHVPDWDYQPDIEEFIRTQDIILEDFFDNAETGEVNE